MKALTTKYYIGVAACLAIFAVGTSVSFASNVGANDATKSYKQESNKINIAFIKAGAVVVTTPARQKKKKLKIDKTKSSNYYSVPETDW